MSPLVGLKLRQIKAWDKIEIHLGVYLEFKKRYLRRPLLPVKQEVPEFFTLKENILRL